MAKSYLDLDIYKISLELFLRVHKFSLRLPKYELYELGSQLRRSADSINSNIVEGYGRKRYKNDFLKFLTYSQASNYETLVHLEKIKALYPNFEKEVHEIQIQYDQLGARINKFTIYVLNSWK